MVHFQAPVFGSFGALWCASGHVLSLPLAQWQLLLALCASVFLGYVLYVAGFFPAPGGSWAAGSGRRLPAHWASSASATRCFRYLALGLVLHAGYGVGYVAVTFLAPQRGFLAGLRALSHHTLVGYLFQCRSLPLPTG